MRRLRTLATGPEACFGVFRFQPQSLHKLENIQPPLTNLISVLAVLCWMSDYVYAISWVA